MGDGIDGIITVRETRVVVRDGEYSKGRVCVESEIIGSAPLTSQLEWTVTARRTEGKVNSVKRLAKVRESIEIRRTVKLFS